jgi:molybdopterin-guanine dinucleotide biosynthesis adapter protein
MEITPTVGIVGFSGSGKTTLAVRLVRRLVDEKMRVAAIKHTHHALNGDRRGDSALLAEAGADPVLLCRSGEAVEFSGDGVRRITYQDVEGLRGGLRADVVIIEGFKGSGAWPRIVVWNSGKEEWDDWQQGVAVVAHGNAVESGRRAAEAQGLPFFSSDQIEELRGFLGRISTA